MFSHYHGLSFLSVLALCTASYSHVEQISTANLTPSSSTTDLAISRTVDTINSIYEKQSISKGSFRRPAGLTIEAGVRQEFDESYSGQSVQAEGHCGVLITHTWREVGVGEVSGWGWDLTDKVLLHLDRSDPLTVTIEPEMTVTPALYEVAITDASTELRSRTGPEIEMSGLLSSISGRTITLAGKSGEALTYKIRKQDFVGGTCISANVCGLSALRVGRYVTVSTEKNGRREIMNYRPEDSLRASGTTVLGGFNDKALAEQTAKAYVHALTLCHNN